MADPKYSDTFLKAVAFILPHEEEFARGHWGDENFVIAENVSGDAGGVTKYGIDASSHPGVDIKDLTRDQAIAIYFEEWRWRDMDALPAKLAIACFDVWVNGGFAIKWLQDSINIVGGIGARLIVDGDLGAKTIAAAQACNQSAVVRHFLLDRDARFERIAANNANDRQFLKGWEQRDADLSKYLAS